MDTPLHELCGGKRPSFGGGQRPCAVAARSAGTARIFDHPPAPRHERAQGGRGSRAGDRPRHGADRLFPLFRARHPDDAADLGLAATICIFLISSSLRLPTEIKISKSYM